MLAVNSFGYQHATVMLVTSLFWWLHDGDGFKMLVENNYVGDFLQQRSLIRRQLFWSVTNKNFLQHPSPTSMQPIFE